MYKLVYYCTVSKVDELSIGDTGADRRHNYLYIRSQGDEEM